MGTYADTSNISDTTQIDAADVKTPLDALDTQLALLTWAGGRLTLSSTQPVPTSDVNASGTVYYLPYGGAAGSGLISLYDSVSAGLKTINFTGSTVSLSVTSLTLSTLYDIFGYLSGSALALEALAWSDSTGGSSSRATALTWQNRLLCKDGDPTRRYLGTIYKASTTTTEDTARSRLVFNAHNQVPRYFTRAETTASWNYGTATWRASNNSITNNRCHVVAGLDGTAISLQFMQTVGGTSRIALVGIAKNGVTPTTYARHDINGISTVTAQLDDVMTAGYHQYTPCEQSASGTTTFYGSSVNHIISGWVMA